MLSPTVYNEFSPGGKGSGSYTGRAAIEFPLLGLTWMAEGDWRHWSYATAGGPVTIIGSGGQTFVPSFNAHEDDVDARLGIKVADPRLYVGASYLWRQNNYGYPQLNGVGFGAEKLPDLDSAISIYGSAYWYPSLQGTFAPVGTLSYRAFRYEIGVDWNFIGPSFPVYLDLGFLGNQYNNKQNAPSNINQYGPYVGLGLHF